MAAGSDGNSNPATNRKEMSDILGNMVLAHELIVNDGFELKTFQENTFEKTIQSIVHKAFWDTIQEQLYKQPPNYTAAFDLLKEIKEIINGLLLPQHDDIKQQLHQNLDLDLIKQEVEKECFDLSNTVQVIVFTMLRICAPVRDKEIKGILEREGLVDILRGIMEALDHMKLDMANAQLQSIKPILIQQSVEYEREKFKAFLEANPDGLSLTKLWLRESYQRCSHRINQQLPAKEEKESNKCIDTQISPAVVINEAYLALLTFDETRICPETLSMDEARLNIISYFLHMNIIALSVIHLAQNTVGMALSSDKEYNLSMKNSLSILLKGVPKGKLQEALSTSIFEQVISNTKKFLDLRGFQSNNNQNQIFKEQLDLLMSENQIRLNQESQLRHFVLTKMTTERNTKLPADFLLMEVEVTELVGKFLRLIDHNKRVFEPIYMELFRDIDKVANE